MYLGICDVNLADVTCHPDRVFVIHVNVRIVPQVLFGNVYLFTLHGLPISFDGWDLCN
jgi:hypothetical protein